MVERLEEEEAYRLRILHAFRNKIYWDKRKFQASIVGNGIFTLPEDK